MAALMQATALRLFNRSNFLLARTYGLSPLTDSSQHLWTRRHEGLSFQFSSGADYASAVVQDLKDEVASPSEANANANANADIEEGEEGTKSSLRHSSRLQPEEAARRTKLGVDFISRYKQGNEGKIPSAGRLAEQVGGSRSWWKTFLLENEDVFSTPVDPTDLRNRSGTSAEVSAEIPEEASETSVMVHGDELASYAGEVMRDIKMRIGGEPMSSEWIEEEKGSGSREGRGRSDLHSPRDNSTQSTLDKKKRRKRYRKSPISVMDGDDALDISGGGNNQELSEASEVVIMKESGEEGDVEDIDEEEEVDEEEEEEEEEGEEGEMEDETERNVYIRNIPSRTTERELLEALRSSLVGVVDVRLPKLNRSRHQFMYGFATFKSARDVQRALEISRQTPIRIRNSTLYMEPNINPKPTPRQQGRRDHSAPPFRHNSNLTEPRNQQLLYPVFLRDVTIPMSEVEKEMRSYGKVVGMTYQPWAGGHVVYFETNEAREYALDQHSLRENQKPSHYKMSSYLFTFPTMIRISSLSTIVSLSELDHAERKLFDFCSACGPNPKIIRRSKSVYDVGYPVPLEVLREILKRVRKGLFSPSRRVEFVKLYDAKSWEEGSRVDGGPGMMKKVLTNKLSKLETSIDLLSVEIQDFKVMLEGLDNIFGTNVYDTKQGVADVEEVDREDMR